MSRAFETVRDAIAKFSAQKISAVAATMVIALSACQSGAEIDNALGLSASPTPISGVIGNSALSLSPTNYNFGLTSVGLVATPLTMVIQNVTGVPIYLSSLNGTADPDFSLSQLDCPSGSQAIAPGATCKAKINFTPLVGGNLQYQVTALFGTSPGDTSLNTNVTLTGIGVDQVTFAGLNIINPANVTTTTVPLFWAAASGASSYTIYQSTDGGSNYIIAQNLSAGTTSWTLSNLTPGTAYTFKAKAFNALGQADSNIITQNAATDALGNFAALADLNTAEGGTVTSSDLGLNCTDAKGHYPSFMSINSASDPVAQCVLLSNPYRVQCTPGFKVGSSPYASTLSISCLLNGYPIAYSKTLNVNVAFTNRPPIIAAIGNQSVLAGTAMATVNPTASSPNLFTLTYGCKYDLLIDGAVAVSAANCSTLFNQNGSSASFSTTTGAFSWTPPLSASGVAYEFKINATDPYSAQASSIFVVSVGEPPPDPVYSTLTLSQSTINAGASSTVTLHAKDASGNVIPKGGSTVTFSASTGGGVGTGNFSATTDNADGTYTATFTGVLSGAATTIRASAQGVALTSALPTVTVNPGAISVANSLLSVSGTSVASGSSITVTLTSKDAAGNLILSGGKTVAFSRSAGSSTGTFSSTADSGNGTYSANFTGAASGTATTISATINGLSLSSTLPNVTVTPGTLSLLQSTLNVAGNASFIQSNAGVLLTLTTRDNSGNLISSGGQTVVISNSGGTSTSSISSVADNGNGTYSATFTGVLAGTATTLSASIGGLTITSALPTISVIPGSASLAQSLVTVGTSSIASGMSTLLTLTAKDANGNFLTSGGSTVLFTKSLSSVGNLSSTTDRGDGTYQANFTGVLVGMTAISASMGGASLTSASPNLSVTPGPVSLAQTQITSSYPSIASGSSVNLILQAKDAAGNNLSAGGSTVVFNRSGGTSQGNFSSVTDNSNGTYSATFTGTTAGTATSVSAAINGSQLTSTPVFVSVVPANLSLANSTLSVSSSSLNAGSSASLTLTTKDSSGNPLTSGGLTVTFGRSGGASSGTFSSIIDHGDGTYSADFTATTSGSPTTLNATIGGSPITSALPSMTVSPGSLSLAQSVVTVSATSVASGSTVIFTLYAKDTSGNLMTTGGQSASFSLGTGSSSGSISGVTDNSNGTYTATFTASTAGTPVSVLATIGGSNVTSAAPSLTVSAGAISYLTSVITLSSNALQSGQTSTATLSLKDANGNSIVIAGLSVFFAKSGGVSNGTFSSVTDHSDGTYTAVLTATTSGSSTSIVGTVGGNSITSTPPTLTVSPGALSLAQSSVSVSGASVVSGSTVNLTLTSKDSNGNTLVAGGSTVVFARGGGTSNGTISGVTDNGNGTYSAVFTAGASGTATSISATIGGAAVTSAAPTITVNAGSVSLSQSTISVSSPTVNSGSNVVLTLTAKDASGNLLITGGSSVLFSRAGGSSNGSISAVTDNSNGTYTASFSATTSGSATTISATVGGLAVTSAAPTITVAAGGISLAQSVVSVSSTNVNSGSSITLTLTAKDINGNPIPSGGSSVVFSRAGGVSSGTISATTDSGNGTYTATFTGTTAGTATTINASVGGSLVSSNLPTVTVNPGSLSLLQSTVTIAGNPTSIASGGSVNLKLTTRDANANQLTSGGQTIVFTATSGTASGAFSALTDNLDGTYSVVFTGATAGSAKSMSATVGGTPLTSTAPTLSVTAGNISYSNSLLALSSVGIQAGSNSTLTLTVKDANGNLLTAGGQTVAFNYSSGGGVSAGSISAVVDQHNGTYTASFTGTTSGTASTISATVAGSAITSALPTITVTPGAVSLAQSQLTVSSSAIVAGFTSTLTLTAKDAYSNTLSAGGLTVSFGTTGSGTSTGAISSVADHANGVYTSVFTGVTAGSAVTITSSVGGSLVTSTSPSIAVSTSTISPSQSTFTLSSNSFTAGNTATATLVLRDGSNNLILDSSQASNLIFSVLATGTSSGTFGPITAVGGSAGTYQSTFTATTAGTANTIQASLSGNGSFNSTPSISIIAAGMSITSSTQSASTNSLIANGTSNSIITVTLRDSYLNPIVGKAVSLTSNRAGNDTISAASGPSSASGVVTFSVSSTLAGTSTYTAKNTTDNLTLTATQAVTFTSGAVSPTLSNVSANLTNIASNGTTTSTITVTLVDANSNPVAGKAVSLSSSRGSNDTISAASGTSTSLGVVTFTVKSIRSGTSVYTANDTTDTIVITPTATVNFLPGTVSQVLSSVAASPTSIVGNGTSSSTLTVTLLDSNSNPVSGKLVTLSSSRNSGSTLDLISAASGPSSASGVVTFSVTSTTAGSGVYTAVDSSDTLTITQTASVAVTAGPANSITFSTGPLASISTDATQTLAVSELDINNNVITTDSTSSLGITGYSTTNCTGGSVTSAFSGTSVTLASGVGTFSSLQIKKTSVKSILATVNAKTACVVVTINPGALNSVAYTTGPANVSTDATQTLRVTEYDANNNIITTDSSSTVTLTPYSSTNCSATALANSVLSSVSTTAVSGIGTWSGLQFYKTAIQSVLATSGAKTICAANLSISSGTATFITATSGNGQSGNGGTTLTNPLVATVTDANLNLVMGTTINWAITGGAGGSLSPCTTLTNASGQVQCNYTLPSAAAGTFVLTATINGTSTAASFSETSTSSPFTFNWATVSANSSTYLIGSSIDFTSTVCELTPAIQTDNSNALAGFGGGTLAGLAFNTLSDGTSTGLKIDTAIQNLEMDASWTPLWSNVVGYWKMNESSWSGTVGEVRDYSPLSLNNGKSIGGAITTASGFFGRGGSFSGAGASVQVNDSASIGITNKITMSTWFNAANNTQNGALVSKWTTGAGVLNSYLIYLGQDAGTNKLGFVIGQSSGTTVSLLPSMTYNASTWNHVVAVADGSKLRLYLNGVEAATSANYDGTIKVTTKNLLLGKLRDEDGLYPFNGVQDETAVWNTALTPEAVAALYQHQVSKFGGTFTSRVIDAFSTGQAWTSFSWITTLPFMKALPDYFGGAIQNELSSDYSSLVGSTGATGVNNLMSGIMGLWHFEETAATSGVNNDFKDSSGGGNFLEQSGTLQFGTSGLFNKAVTFNGASDYAFGTLDGTALTSLSVSLWVKPANNTDVTKGIFQWATTISAGGPFILIRQNTNTFSVYVNNSYVFTYGLAAGAWQHIALTLNSSNLWTLYLNGVSMGTYQSGATNANQANAARVYFGNGYNGYFAGSVDEAAIWGRTLHANEVKQLYQRGASRIKVQTRSCIAADCSNVADVWKGPDGTSNSYFSELNNMSVQSAIPSGTVKATPPNMTLQTYSTPVSTNRYFQYRTIFESDSSLTTLMPELKSVTVGPNHYSSSAPTVIGKSGVPFISLSNFIQTLGSSGCSGGVVYNLGIGATYSSATWYWYNGSTWVAANGTTANTNNAASILANLSSFNTQFGGGTVFFKSFLQSNGLTACELQNIRIDGQH